MGKLLSKINLNSFILKKYIKNINGTTLEKNRLKRHSLALSLYSILINVIVHHVTVPAVDFRQNVAARRTTMMIIVTVVMFMLMFVRSRRFRRASWYSKDRFHSSFATRRRCARSSRRLCKAYVDNQSKYKRG